MEKKHGSTIERDGLICRTGEFRDGWPVYVTTNKSRAKEEIERLERLNGE
jgi:hypothetical protein